MIFNFKSRLKLLNLFFYEKRFLNFKNSYPKLESCVDEVIDDWCLESPKEKIGSLEDRDEKLSDENLKTLEIRNMKTSI